MKILVVKIVGCYLGLYRNIVSGLWGKISSNDDSIVVNSFTGCGGSGYTIRLQGEPL